MCLDISRMANPMKNGFTTFLTGVFNLIPIRFLEYMVVPAIMSYPCFWMIASRSFHVVANFTSFVSTLSPRIWYISTLPTTCTGSSPQWSWTLLVSHSTCSHIQIWTVLAWIKWGGEYEWLDIPVEYQVEGMSNEQDTFDEVQYHRWVLVYSILSLYPRYRSSQHISWFHQSTCLPSVSKRMEDHWICNGVVWVLRYCAQWSSVFVKCVEWLHPFDRISIDLLHHLFSLRHTHQLVGYHSMHGSSVKVVRIEIINAFLALSCLLLVVDVYLSMSFHDLSDLSSKVLQ